MAMQLGFIAREFFGHDVFFRRAHYHCQGSQQGSGPKIQGFSKWKFSDLGGS